MASARARSKIRHALRAREKERGRELGREILDRDLRKAGLSLPRLLESGGLDEIAQAEAKGQVDELFALVGYGRLASADVVRQLPARRRRSPRPPPEPPRRRGLFRRQPRGGALRASAWTASPTCWCASRAAARRCPATT